MGALTTFFSIFTKVVQILPLGITAAETVAGFISPGKKTGPQKLDGVKQVVSESLNIAALVAGRQIVDRPLFDQGLEQMIDGGVLIMKACQPQS
jgi:hypothetical protein